MMKIYANISREKVVVIDESGSEVFYLIEGGIDPRVGAFNSVADLIYAEEKTGKLKPVKPARKKKGVNHCGKEGHKRSTCPDLEDRAEVVEDVVPEDAEGSLNEMRGRGAAITPTKLLKCKEMLKRGDVSNANIADELGIPVERVESIRDQLGL